MHPGKAYLSSTDLDDLREDFQAAEYDSQQFYRADLPGEAHARFRMSDEVYLEAVRLEKRKL